MNWNEPITIVLASAGGSAVVIGGLAAWIGKVWADRIIEAQKAIYAKEIAQLESTLELERNQKQKVSERQFALCCDIWNILQDLRTFGDMLWSRADLDTMNLFRNAYQTAKLLVSRGRLFFRDDQYQRLWAILSSFGDYEVGKKRLIEIRSATDLQGAAAEVGDVQYVEDRIRSQIQHNGARKQEYEQLLEELLSDFQCQLGLRPSATTLSDRALQTVSRPSGSTDP